MYPYKYVKNAGRMTLRMESHRFRKGFKYRPMTKTERGMVYRLAMIDYRHGA